ARVLDRSRGVPAIPVRVGVARSLRISRAMHVGTIAAMVALGVVANLGQIYVGGVAGVGALLADEQALLRVDDLSQVKRAFDLNGYVGILYLVTTTAAIYVR